MKKKKAGNAIEFRKPQKSQAEIMKSVKLKLPWYLKQIGIPFLQGGRWYANVQQSRLTPLIIMVKKLFNKQMRTVQYELHQNPKR